MLLWNEEAFFSGKLGNVQVMKANELLIECRVLARSGAPQISVLHGRTLGRATARHDGNTHTLLNVEHVLIPRSVWSEFLSPQASVQVHNSNRWKHLQERAPHLAMSEAVQIDIVRDETQNPLRCGL